MLTHQQAGWIKRAGPVDPQAKQERNQRRRGRRMARRSWDVGGGEVSLSTDQRNYCSMPWKNGEVQQCGLKNADAGTDLNSYNIQLPWRFFKRIDTRHKESDKDDDNWTLLPRVHHAITCSPRTPQLTRTPWSDYSSDHVRVLSGSRLFPFYPLGSKISVAIIFEGVKLS